MNVQVFYVKSRSVARVYRLSLAYLLVVTTVLLVLALWSR